MLFVNLISLYLLLVTVAAVFCAVQIRTLNGSNYTMTALILCFAICLYILGYTMELNSSTPSQIVFWNQIEYIGIPFVSALWLTTALMYTGHFTRYKKSLLAAIYIIPIITMILRFTNDSHHLYFASTKYMDGLGGLLFVKQSGPWLYVQMIHSMSMILISMSLFIYHSMKNREKQAGKVLLIITASAFAVTGLFLSQFKPSGFQIDYMALCLPITCIMVIMAISRYDLLETKSVARGKVFEKSSDTILLINSRGRILDYNNSARRLFEQLDVRLDKKNISFLFEKIPDLLEGLKKADPIVLKLQIDGEERYFDITTESIGDRKTPRGWIKIIRDVTKTYQLHEELKRLAMTDELSVLSNRRAFMKTGKALVLQSDRNNTPLYLVMMDLDNFKNVNDQYGHPAGDLAIREFSQMLKGHFDSNNVIARLGGEEFAILIENCTDEDAFHLVESFLKKAEQHIFRCSGNCFHVTVSIGMTKRLPGSTLENMMGRADKALYRSKDQGRNCITVM